MNLLDVIHKEQAYDDKSGWKPKPLPSLANVKEVELDFETNGLRWYDGARPGGFGLCIDGETQYVPFAHRGDPNNLDEGQVKEWCRRELPGKRITNLSTKFEVHMSREWGVDLEALGCSVSDVGHSAALLDDHRKQFSLASIVADYLEDEEKVTVVNGVELDASRMMEYPASMVAVRAEGDVRQVWKLKNLFKPMLEKEDLMRVHKLEDEVIFATCEMEKNASPLDMEKLHIWKKAIEQNILRRAYNIHRETGYRINPDSPADWVKLFQHLKIPVTQFTEGGRPSFTDEVLSRIPHPIVQDARMMGKMKDLLSKFIDKAIKSPSVIKDGLFRYGLHQLRAQKADYKAGEAGTVSGRFSSTEIYEGDGGNIQQILAVEKQIDKYGIDFIIRELFIAGTPGAEYLAADAQQIEYRIFADKAANPKVLKAYKDNPGLSFHEFIWELLLPMKPDLLYKPLKNLNFAKIYGAGPAKIALMMGYITQAEFDELQRESKGRGVPRSHPKLARVKAVLDVYDRELPEVQPLMNFATRLAEERGYVKTILGRRMRFPEKVAGEGRQRTHKALNGVIQGSAADLMKIKMVEMHKERKFLGFVPRITNHDELTGDAVHGPETKKRVEELLNTQSVELKVPILWDVETGIHWGACDKKVWKKVEAERERSHA